MCEGGCGRVSTVVGVVSVRTGEGGSGKGEDK